MSSNYPPVGPPSGPPSGPPAGPPSGPPPGYRPEMLDSGDGGSLPPSGGSGGGGRRKAVIAGGTLVGLAAVGAGGYFAWSAAFGTGAQASEALPSSTLGFVSVDLDPSGEQKVAAIETLEKFPGFSQATGVDPDSDVREVIFNEITESEDCAVDFNEDVEPWLGNTFGFAAVALDGEGSGEPVPVAVMEVSDAGAAEETIDRLISECGGDADEGGISIEGDWALVTETQEQADQVRDAAEEGTLADDEDYQRWMDAAGDPGIVSAYASAEAGATLVRLSSELTPMQGAETADSAEQLSAALEGFEGAALNVRFADGGLEVETATSSSASGLEVLASTDRGGDVVETLPEDTAVAFGAGFEDGWFQGIIDYASSFGGPQMDVEEQLAFLEAQSGLAFPEDPEALLGDSSAVALGGDFDPAALGTDPTAIPAGLKVQGDTAAARAVIEKLFGNPSFPPGFENFVSIEDDGEFLAGSASPDYTARLLEDGGLGDTEAYQEVVPNSDEAASVLFVNFDAGSWLDQIPAMGGGEAAGYVEPLAALGLASWSDDDGVTHGLLKLTTDD